MIAELPEFKWSILPNERDSVMVQHARTCEPGPYTTWHEDTIGYIKETYNKETFRTCIDAGASYGFLSVPFSFLFEKVHSFEPHPEVLEHLRKNVEPYSNIEIHPEALYNIESILSLACYSNISGTSTIKEGIAPGEPSIFQVHTRTLDSYEFEDVDFIKIDVEGSEKKLLLGAALTIEKYRPVIFCEIHSQRHSADYLRRRTIFNFFESLNYKLHDIRFHDYLFLPQ
jgi:FkbM family methyltransferase